MSSRPGVVLLLGSALLAAACDTGGGGEGQARTAATAPDEATGSAAATAPRSGVFDRSRKGETAPAAQFVAPGGGRTRLADFRGQPLLVNLWATWCAPCVAELPTLDAAAAKHRGRLRVLAVSQDLEETPTKVEAFLKRRGLANLQPYRDPGLSLSTAFAANLPVTILYDARGREVWRRLGPFEWNGAEADKALAEAG